MDSMPEKCGDPGPCLVTCPINGVQFMDSMCGLGACVSIMSLSIYEVFKNGLPSKIDEVLPVTRGHLENMKKNWKYQPLYTH